MIVVADTNIVARLVMQDDEQQFQAAARLVGAATKIAVPSIVFCELVWVLRSSYKRDSQYIAKAIRGLLQIKTLVTDDDAVLAGLQMLESNGDFADGVVQYTGNQLAGGSSIFVSFDKAAVTRFLASGITAIIPSGQEG
jgi:predicted nucleic-acid-binding protein